MSCLIALGGRTASHHNGAMNTVLRIQTIFCQSRSYTRKLNIEEEEQRRMLASQLRRDWKIGDVYAPHDLSAAEMRKWSRKHRPNTDAFDTLSLDPISLYKNFSIMSEYVTDMGRIRPLSETGLRPVNQRKIAKAIRRAIALGLMPSVHKHPEILKEQYRNSPYKL